MGGPSGRGRQDGEHPAGAIDAPTHLGGESDVE